MKKYAKIVLIVLIVFVLLLAAISILPYFYYDKRPVIDHLLTQQANMNYDWQCQKIKSKSLNASKSVKWSRYHCIGKYPRYYLFHIGRKMRPLTINIINANLDDKHIQLTPVLAAKTRPMRSLYTETIPSMAKSHPNYIAGINGGYFFTNRMNHPDQNCSGRTYPEKTVQHIGDGLLVINRHTFSENCYLKYFPTKKRIAIVENKKHQWAIKNVGMHITPHNTLNALGAGPALVRTVNGKAKIDIQWQGILSSFEFAANTAAILAKDAKGHQHIIFFTVDGVDKQSGINAVEMSNFIVKKLPSLLHLKIISAMSMDQGHSTTMYVRGEGKQGVVSAASKHRDSRAVYDGLFLAYKH
jgi:exopolysaccharide biosynthesis protein